MVVQGGGVDHAGDTLHGFGDGFRVSDRPDNVGCLGRAHIQADGVAACPAQQGDDGLTKVARRAGDKQGQGVIALCESADARQKGKIERPVPRWADTPAERGPSDVKSAGSWPRAVAGGASPSRPPRDIFPREKGKNPTPIPW